MSGKTLKYERVFNEDRLHAQGLIDSSIGAMQRSVVNAFLDNVEYGRDYIIRTRTTNDPMDYGMKYVCTLTFDELIRCRDCDNYGCDGYDEHYCYYWDKIREPDAFCSQAVKA